MALTLTVGPTPTPNPNPHPHQAHYYGVRELVEAVLPKVVTCRYGLNQPLLLLLRERGVLG